MIAAASAAEAGAHVALVERSGMLGGTFAISGGLLHIWDPKTWEEYSQVCPDINPRLGRLVFSGFHELISWFESIGAPFVKSDFGPNPLYHEPERRTGVYVLGGNQLIKSAEPIIQRVGPHLWRSRTILGLVGISFVRAAKRSFVSRLETTMRQAGAEIFLRARAISLVGDARSGVGGIVIRRGGTRREMKCKAVILANGGFQGNAALREKFMGENGAALYCRASPYNQGDGLLMAVKAGAELTPSMDGFYGHAWPVNCSVDDQNDHLGLLTTTAYYSRHGILVNFKGERFSDEYEGESTGLNANRIARQPGGKAWIVLDQGVRNDFCFTHLQVLGDVDTLKSAQERGATVLTAHSVDELADGMASHGVDRSRLIETIREFDGAVARGEATRLKIPRTGSFHRLATPPFYAVLVTAGVSMTYGGISIDEGGRVHGETGSIPGLFGVPGVAGGIYRYHYGGALAACGVFGRIAGKNAAAYAKSGGWTPVE